MSPIPISLAAEDALQEVLLRTLLAQAGQEFAVGTCYRRGGAGYLRQNIGGFNVAARGTPFLVLTDLDAKPCPSNLIEEWLTEPRHPNLIFRVAVREAETWLLADREIFAGYLGVSKDRIPEDVEGIADPKAFLVLLAKRGRRAVREKLVPDPATGARVGPEYNTALGAFVRASWNADRAGKLSRSVSRAMAALRAFRPTWEERKGDARLNRR